MPPTLRRKVVVIGDPAVGKSALVHMFASSGTRFPKQYNMTCGVELAHKITQVAPPAAESEANVELYMFDSGGQDMFDEMLPPFWEGARWRHRPGVGCVGARGNDVWACTVVRRAIGAPAAAALAGYWTA